MQIGIDSFAAAISDPATGLTLSPVDRIHHLLEEIELADRVGHRQAGSYEAGPSDYNSTAKRVSRQCVISWRDADFPALIKAVCMAVIFVSSCNATRSWWSQSGG